MSLFGNDKYQWRETYFVYFHQTDRPLADDVAAALADGRSELGEVRADTDGGFEAITVRSSEDFSAMDIIYVTGDEIAEQIEEVLRSLIKQTLTEDDQHKMNLIGECDARFDIFHFEEIQAGNEGEEFLDPGALLLVMERLARLCRGVGIDPQSGSLIA